MEIRLFPNYWGLGADLSLPNNSRDKPGALALIEGF